MATTHGNEGAVYTGSNAIAEVTAWSYSGNVNLTPDAALGDTAETYVSDGITRGSGSFSAWWDATDTNGQVSIGEGDTITLNVYAEGNTSSNKYYTGSVIIESIEMSGDTGSIVSRNYTFKGVLTEGTVA